MSERRRKVTTQYNDQVRSDAAIAVLNKNSNSDSESKGTLACVLPWGHGWGWATLPNGVWSGGLYMDCFRQIVSAQHTFLQIKI